MNQCDALYKMFLKFLGFSLKGIPPQTLKIQSWVYLELKFSFRNKNCKIMLTKEYGLNCVYAFAYVYVYMCIVFM